MGKQRVTELMIARVSHMARVMALAHEELFSSYCQDWGWIFNVLNNTAITHLFLTESARMYAMWDKHLHSWLNDSICERTADSAIC